MGTDLYMNDINNNLVLRIPEYKKKGLPWFSFSLGKSLFLSFPIDSPLPLLNNQFTNAKTNAEHSKWCHCEGVGNDRQWQAVVWSQLIPYIIESSAGLEY